jgi:hypothetical protein
MITNDMELRPYFATLEVASGVTISSRYRRHWHQEFLRFLNDIDANLPRGFEVHLVMDNYGTHKVSKVRTWLARRPSNHVHLAEPGGTIVCRTDGTMRPLWKQYRRSSAGEGRA